MPGLEEFECAHIVVFGLRVGAIDEIERGLAGTAVGTHTCGEECRGKVLGPFQWSFSTNLGQSFDQATFKVLDTPVRLRVVCSSGICSKMILL